MNIQENLNTLLAMGAIAARTSDRYQRNVELKKLKGAEKTQKAINQVLSDKNEEELLKEKYNPVTQKLEQEGLEELHNIQKQKASLDPSKKNIEEASKTEQLKADFAKGFEEGEQEYQQLVEEEENEARLKKMQQERISNMTAQEFTMFQELKGTISSRLNQYDALKQRQEALKQKQANREDYLKSKGFEF